MMEKYYVEISFISFGGIKQWKGNKYICVFLSFEMFFLSFGNIFFDLCHMKSLEGKNMS